MGNNIRLAEIEDKDDIVKLLNKVALNLKAKGINQWDYPWNHEEITLDIINRNIYIMLLDEVIAGTFAIRKLEEEKFGLMKMGDNYIYRIALLPEFQGKSLGREIINYARKRVNRLYLDCYNGNKNLRQFYMNAGLKYVGDFPEEDYFVSVFYFEEGKL